MKPTDTIDITYANRSWEGYSVYDVALASINTMFPPEPDTARITVDDDVKCGVVVSGSDGFLVDPVVDTENGYVAFDLDMP